VDIHKPKVVYLALGSNMGDRRAQLRTALECVAPFVEVVTRSEVYETAPAYVADQPRYLNMVLEGRTLLEPLELLQALKDVERKMGRGGGVRWGPRPIDLDILLYDDMQLATPELQIPHARLAERAFVLVPLAELAPTLVPPGLDASVAELARGAPPMGDILARLGPLE